MDIERYRWCFVQNPGRRNEVQMNCAENAAFPSAVAHVRSGDPVGTLRGDKKVLDQEDHRRIAPAVARSHPSYGGRLQIRLLKAGRIPYRMV
jgi:hypothetical protein